MPESSPILLRIYHSDGYYPEYQVQTEDHLFVSSPSLVWSAVRQPPVPREDVEGELAWLHPEEIRLLAAISLVEGYPEQYGRFRLHPWSHAVRLEGPAFEAEFGSTEFLSAAEEQARALEAEVSASEWHVPRRPKPYELGDNGIPQGVVELIEAIDTNDHLLLRGLSKLLSANHLRSFPPFMEEAAMAAYVSMEAALTFIKSHLEDQAGTQIPFEQVFDYVERTFPTGERLCGVLKMDYDARVMMLHPASRYGEWWTPPVFAEELMDLLYSLVYLYRHILLGDIWDPDEEERRRGAELSAQTQNRPSA